MHSKLGGIRRAVGACLVAGLLLSACGDDSEAESGSQGDGSGQGSSDGGSSEEDSGSGDGSSSPSQAVAPSDYLGSYTIDDEEFGTRVEVNVDGGTRTVQSNALPDTETGEFPNSGNPNSIAAQDVTYEYPTEPSWTGEASEARTVGVSVNGLKYEPGTAETVQCQTGETYRVEALQDTYDLGLDFNNAHVQPDGEYHYHGISELMVEAFDSGEDLVHVGFAADGYLMYYSTSGAYEPGYSLSEEPRTGTGCEGSLPMMDAPDELEGTTPDGTYTSDYVFDESTGDLDECNGTEIDGQYVYLVTEGFPYVSRCLKGEFAEQDQGPPGAGGPP